MGAWGGRERSLYRSLLFSSPPLFQLLCLPVVHSMQRPKFPAHFQLSPHCRAGESDAISRRKIIGSDNGKDSILVPTRRLPATAPRMREKSIAGTKDVARRAHYCIASHPVCQQPRVSFSTRMGIQTKVVTRVGPAHEIFDRRRDVESEGIDNDRTSFGRFETSSPPSTSIEVADAYHRPSWFRDSEGSNFVKIKPRRKMRRLDFPRDPCSAVTEWRQIALAPFRDHPCLPGSSRLQVTGKNRGEFFFLITESYGFFVCEIGHWVQTRRRLTP